MKGKIKDRGPYPLNDNIHVFYELQFGKDVITPGTLIKIKNKRETFKFIQLVHNDALEVKWVDVRDTSLGMLRSFYIENIKGVIKPKRTRRKKTT